MSDPELLLYIFFVTDWNVVIELHIPLTFDQRPRMFHILKNSDQLSFCGLAIADDNICRELKGIFCFHLWLWILRFGVRTVLILPRAARKRRSIYPATRGQRWHLQRSELVGKAGWNLEEQEGGAPSRMSENDDGEDDQDKPHQWIAVKELLQGLSDRRTNLSPAFPLCYTFLAFQGAKEEAKTKSSCG